MRTINVSPNARLFLAHVPHGGAIEAKIPEFLRTKAFSVAHIHVWGEAEEASVELMTPDGPVKKEMKDTVVSFHATGLVTPDDPFRLHGWISGVIDGEWLSYHGVLTHARVLSAEVRIEAFAETVLDRVANPLFGSLVWRNAAAKKVSGRARSYDNEVKVPSLGSSGTSRFEKEAEAPEEGSPATPLRKGDIVIHHAFGECEVLEVMSADDVVRLRVKGPPSREVRLALRVLTLEKVETREDGRSVFKAHKRGR